MAKTATTSGDRLFLGAPGPGQGGATVRRRQPCPGRPPRCRCGRWGSCRAVGRGDGASPAGQRRRRCLAALAPRALAAGGLPRRVPEVLAVLVAMSITPYSTFRQRYHFVLRASAKSLAQAGAEFAMISSTPRRTRHGGESRAATRRPRRAPSVPGRGSGSSPSGTRPRAPWSHRSGRRRRPGA
jgi:hypothetical protein